MAQPTRPPPRPTQPSETTPHSKPKDPLRTYNTLLARSNSSDLVFRVHSPSSSCPLLWTGDLATSGFACPNANLAIHTPTTYSAVIASDPPWDRVPAPSPQRPPHYRSSTYASASGTTASGASVPRADKGVEDRLGAYLAHTITDHIHGKPRQTSISMPSDISERPGTPEDEHSPWISTSGDLGWCIWEISRRLSIPSSAYFSSRPLSETPGAQVREGGGREEGAGIVGIAAIKHDPRGPSVPSQHSAAATENLMDTDINESDTVDEEHASTEKEKEKEEYTPPELHIHPVPHLTTALARGRGRAFSTTMRVTYEDSISMARTSSEVLYYGRIFAGSIERNWDFTREVRPPPFSSVPSHPCGVVNCAKSNGERSAEIQNLPFALPPEFWAPPPPPSIRSKAGKYKASTTLASGIGASFLHGASSSPIQNDPRGHSRPSSGTTLRHHDQQRTLRTEESWLDRLVWDRVTDDYRSAMIKVRRRREELARSGRSEQR